MSALYACVLTIVIETAFFACTKYRKTPLFLLLCAGVNGATNLAMNVSVEAFSLPQWSFIPLELLVVTVEYLLYRSFFNVLWQKKGRVLGEGSVFGYCDSGMTRNDDNGFCAMAGYSQMTRRLDVAIHRAKDFVEYHERHADEHGGLNLDDCHEWGNARHYDGGKDQPRSLQYGIRLSFNDGAVRFFTITSKPESEL